MKPGSLVVNLSPHTFAQIFSAPLHENRARVGILSGVGLVIGTKGSDILVVSPGGTGWCWSGNVVKV